ncbi:8381_t:CDS:2, partial [Rhizophagus irregularis]
MPDDGKLGKGVNYDIENPTSNLTLGQTFQTWDEAEKFLNDYALEKGFSIRRKRTENDDNKILRKISWECCCAGNYQPKKILNPNDQRNRQSKATGSGANSTQRVESLNHKIHDCVRSNSSLLTLVKEIQYVLDKESEYARVEEYKDQIPIVGLATIPKAYFKSIKKVVSEFLMPAMVFLVCKQMQECFYYDSFKMNVAIIDSIIQ